MYTHHMSPILKTGEVLTVSWYGNFMEKENLEDRDVDGRIVLNSILSMEGDLAGS
jgi:hypothetical protein